jgi:hypothetical protein
MAISTIRPAQIEGISISSAMEVAKGSESEIKEHFDELVEQLDRLLPEGSIERKLLLMNSGVNQIVATNFAVEDDPNRNYGEATRVADYIMSTLEPLYTEGEWEGRERGILGEVCTRMALYEAGFAVSGPRYTQDMEGVDIFARKPEGPYKRFPLAINVKAIKELREVEVVHVMQDHRGNPVVQDRRDTEAARKLLAVVNAPENRTKNYAPVIIKLPCSMWGTTAFNVRNGVPARDYREHGLTRELYGKIRTEVWNPVVSPQNKRKGGAA